MYSIMGDCDSFIHHWHECAAVTSSILPGFSPGFGTRLQGCGPVQKQEQNRGTTLSDQTSLTVCEMCHNVKVETIILTVCTEMLSDCIWKKLHKLQHVVVKIIIIIYIYIAVYNLMVTIQQEKSELYKERGKVVFSAKKSL